MNQIHYHANRGGEQARLNEEIDLIPKWTPPCNDQYKRPWQSQLGLFFIIWWYTTFCASAVLIFGAALMLNDADEIDSVGAFGTLMAMYISISAIIESVRSQKNRKKRDAQPLD